MGDDAQSLGGHGDNSGRVKNDYNSIDSFNKDTFVSEDDPYALKLRYRDHELATIDVFSNNTSKSRRNKSFSLPKLSSYLKRNPSLTFEEDSLDEETEQRFHAAG